MKQAEPEREGESIKDNKLMILYKIINCIYISDTDVIVATTVPTNTTSIIIVIIIVAILVQVFVRSLLLLLLLLRTFCCQLLLPGFSSVGQTLLSAIQYNI